MGKTALKKVEAKRSFSFGVVDSLLKEILIRLIFLSVFLMEHQSFFGI